MGDIDIVETKDGKPAIQLSSLISQMFEYYRYSSEQDKQDLIESIFYTKDFNKMLKEYLQYGDSDGNCSNYVHRDYKLEYADATRLAVMEVLDVAALELVKTMITRESHYRDIIEEKNNHIKKLISVWPESHKQYLPKEDFVSVGYDPDLDEKARKLLKESNNKEQEK